MSGENREGPGVRVIVIFILGYYPDKWLFSCSWLQLIAGIQALNTRQQNYHFSLSKTCVVSPEIWGGITVATFFVFL